MISALKGKHLDVTTTLTYSHTNTPLGQSGRAYYLYYFINGFRRKVTMKRRTYPARMIKVDDVIKFEY